MSNDTIISHFSDKERDEFNAMLKLYFRNNLLRAILKEISREYGQSSQMLFWNLTSSKIWSELCKAYGLNTTNRAINLFLKRIKSENKTLIDIIKKSIKQHALMVLMEKMDLLSAHIDINKLEELMQEIE